MFFCPFGNSFGILSKKCFFCYPFCTSRYDFRSFQPFQHLFCTLWWDFLFWLEREVPEIGGECKKWLKIIAKPLKKQRKPAFRGARLGGPKPHQSMQNQRFYVRAAMCAPAFNPHGTVSVSAGTGAHKARTSTNAARPPYHAEPTLFALPHLHTHLWKHAQTPAKVSTGAHQARTSTSAARPPYHAEYTLFAVPPLHTHLWKHAQTPAKVSTGAHKVCTSTSAAHRPYHAESMLFALQPLCKHKHKNTQTTAKTTTGAHYKWTNIAVFHEPSCGAHGLGFSYHYV
jgi:hypothetical protein